MPLQEAELEQIGGYVRTHLGEWLAQAHLAWSPESYERNLRERMVRVKEELRHQGELIQQGFARMEKSFEQVDKRLEQVDRRFEEMTRRIDRFMVWSFGVTVAAGGTVIGVLKAWP